MSEEEDRTEIEEEEEIELVVEHTEWFLDMMFVIFEEGAKKQFNRSEVLTIMRKVYHDSMLHGYKHGFEDGKKEVD